MFGAARIFVRTDDEVIRVMVDLANLVKPESERIKDTEYSYFEGLVKAQREYGTINSASSEDYVKRYCGKPDMSRKSFLVYRNSLVNKGWVIRNGDYVKLPAGFDLFDKKLKTSGVITGCLVERIEDALE